MSETYIDSDGSELRVERFNDSVRFLSAKNKLHRLDGPAIEWEDGEKHRYKNGRLHRLDGPALEYPDGDKEWWVEDEPVEPLFLVAYWLERGRCCWFDEEANELRFGDG